MATLNILGVLNPSIDPTTGRHVDPRVLAKREIATLEADEKLTAKQRKVALSKARQHLQNLEDLFGPNPVPADILRLLDDHMRRKQQTRHQ